MVITGEIYNIERDDSDILLKIVIEQPKTKYPDDIKNDWKKVAKYNEEHYIEEKKKRDGFLKQCKLGKVEIKYIEEKEEGEKE